MLRLTFALIFVCFTFFSCNKKSNNYELLAMNLKSVDGEVFSFQQLLANKASVFIFLQPECPFCNSYGKTLKTLDSTYRLLQVKIYGVVAGINYPNSQILEYCRMHQLQFPVLLDPEFELTKKLNATITPQAFLVSQKGAVIYHGMIDNWGYEIGKTRARATEFYLTAAVNDFLAGKKTSTDSTKAIGCYIQ